MARKGKIIDDIPESKLDKFQKKWYYMNHLKKQKARQKFLAEMLGVFYSPERYVKNNLKLKKKKIEDLC